MYIGAAYYPEQWELEEGEERWETDALLMQQAGFNVTRLAEFSWASLESETGEFQFGWLERAIDVMDAHGIKTILCTPTASIPKWLYDRYPGAVATDATGLKIPYGGRHNNCFSSTEFCRLSQRITQAMADNFKDNPSVIAWQLDNEFGGPECFCPTCENKFQMWLHNKYKSIDTLNRVFGTVFWSQKYDDFSQVNLPRHPHVSPSLLLDYRRFHSENVISFSGEQADILRKICPTHLLTHNMMGFAPKINCYELGKQLDLISFDYYYNTYEQCARTIEGCQKGAAALDFMRSVKHQNFWIMENSVGSIGWETYGRNLRPGELRRMAFQNAAHGSDGQVWFRFRSSRYGTEQYWQGILGHDGIPGRRFAEVASVSKELHQLYVYIEGSRVKADIAIVLDYEDYWALIQQPNHPDFDYVSETTKFHRAFAQFGLNIDFVNSSMDLTRYAIVVAPYKYLLTEQYAETIRQHVKNGGIFLATNRSGEKNEYNVPHALTLPGYLRDVLGVRVEEYESIDADCPYTFHFDGESFKANMLVDWVIPETAKALAVYQDDHIKQYAAITVNHLGKGKAYYVGATMGGDAVERLVGRMLEVSFPGSFGLLPDGLEIVTRSTDDKKFVFLLNHTNTDQIVRCTGMDLLSGSIFHDSVCVKAHDVMVVLQQSVSSAQ